MLDADCDVWLLTEVNERTTYPGTPSPVAGGDGPASSLGSGRQPASHDLEPGSAPRERCGAGRRDNVRQLGAAVAHLGSVIHGSGPVTPTRPRVVAELLLRLRGDDSLVWGGDWNHALDRQ